MTPGLSGVRISIKSNLTLILLKVNNLEVGFNFVEVRSRVGVAMGQTTVTRPAWLEVLDEEDLRFVQRFLLASGSLKAMAQEYGVSYPTVRSRLDRLIAKVRAAEDPGVTDPFERRLRALVADGKLTAALARELLEAHRASPGREG
jgi:hypothetical protein